MKVRNVTAICTLGLAILLAVYFAIVVRDAKRMAWHDRAKSGIRTIALYMDNCIEQSDDYPKDIHELAAQLAEDERKYLALFVRDPWNTRYSWAVSSNGVLISAEVCRQGLFPHQEMRQFFQRGEGRAQYHEQAR